MAEYSPGIEAQIASVLRSRGRVTSDEIPGIPSEEATFLLRRYAVEHAADGAIFDGSVLRADTDQPAESVTHVTPRDAPVSPIDQVLAAPLGPALLDSAPAGRPVSRWLWAMPLALGAVGGVIAWLLARDESPRTARNLLVTGVVVTVVTTCLPLACVLAGTPFGALSDAVPSGSDEWPVTPSGLTTFYYFGTDT